MRYKIVKPKIGPYLLLYELLILECTKHNFIGDNNLATIFVYSSAIRRPQLCDTTTVTARLSRKRTIHIPTTNVVMHHALE